MSIVGDKEELYRRLVQSRRHAAGHHDDVTQGRLKALVGDLETQIAAVEAKDSDDPRD